MNVAMPAGSMPAVSQIVDYIWQYVSKQINTGVAHEVTLPIIFKSVIGDQGIAVIATRFRYLIQAPVVTVENAAVGIVRIYAERNPLGHVVDDLVLDGSKEKAMSAKKDKIPRPPNAFILYRQHHHPLIKAKNPGMHNNQISIILGTQWRSESHTMKEHWKLKAEAIKQQHLRDYPEYSYQPRKPSEKKRRMTRKISALNTEVSPAITSTPSSNETSPDTSMFESPVIATDNAPTHLPEFEKTPGGNLVVNIGDQDMDDEAFKAMLEEYNKSLPPLSRQALARAGSGCPVIYNELSEEAQNDFNFYNSMVNWESVERENAQAEADFQAQFDALIDDDFLSGAGLNQATNEYDAQQAVVADAELSRMNSAFD